MGYGYRVFSTCEREEGKEKRKEGREKRMSLLAELTISDNTNSVAPNAVPTVMRAQTHQDKRVSDRERRQTSRTSNGKSWTPCQLSPSSAAVG